jgi:D-alanine-D-alanine ligase
MKIIGTFFGSRSPEHDISILTAMRVIAGFRGLPKYQAIPIYINRRGEWFAGEGEGALGDIAFFRAPRLEERLKPYAISSVSFGNNTLMLLPRRKFFQRGRPIKIEIAFPCIHGSFGEDGTIQGLFEMAGVPYVGCGVRASATAMSKIHTRRLLRDLGIPGVPTVVINREEFRQNKAEAMKRAAQDLSFPMFVKPNALGSSIGVSGALNAKELEWALEVAFQFDTQALAEKAIQNLKEINVAVIGHCDLIVSETE